MNKYEYLSQLRVGLATLSKDDREEAMSYYEEFFNDAGEDNEQAVIASLGTPEELAKSIIKENATQPEVSDGPMAAPGTSGFESGNNGFVAPETPKQTAQRQGKNWSGGQIALVVVLLVLSFPIWIGFVAGAFGIAIGFIAAAFGLLVGIGAGAVGSLVCGIITLFVNPMAGLFMIGCGLILGGLIPLAVYPLCKLVVKLFQIIIKGIGSLINKLSGKTGVA